MGSDSALALLHAREQAIFGGGAIGTQDEETTWPITQQDQEQAHTQMHACAWRDDKPSTLVHVPAVGESVPLLV